MGHVFIDADHEMIFGVGFFEFVEDGFDHGRGKFFRRQPIASPDHLNTLVSIFEQGAGHIQVERFAGCAGFLGAVKNGNGLDALWQGFDEMPLCRMGGTGARG